MAASLRNRKRKRTKSTSTPISPSQANREVEEATSEDTAPPSPARPNIEPPSPARPNIETQVELLSRIVGQVTHQSRGENTPLAYDPKQAEFYTYCDHAYLGVHEQSRYTVTSIKLFDFLFYHSFRNQYPRGGGTRGKAHGFDITDYDHVRTTYASYMQTMILDPTGEYEIPDPEKPVGFDCINTYKAVVFGVWSEQAATGSNSTSWDLIFTRRVKQLLSLVAKRKTRIKRANYHEKIDGDFTPFTSMGQVNNIEEKFWEGGKTARGCLPGLRNRYIFLQCYSGLLRSETMFLGELSDMLNIEYQRQQDCDPYEILILQIAAGKSFFFIVFLL
jgi:hypothetical protein